MPKTTSSLPNGPQVRLRCLRELLVGTADQLAERIAEHGVRVTAAHIRAVELGQQRASKHLLTAWAHALGLGPLDIWQPPAEADDLMDAEDAA